MCGPVDCRLPRRDPDERCVIVYDNAAILHPSLRLVQGACAFFED